MDKKNQKKLNQKHDEIKKNIRNYAGYPCNADFNYEELFKFLTVPLNNIGDTYGQNNYQLNTHEFEKEVLEFTADMLGSKPGDHWGYITQGGSEGNLCAINMARNKFPEGMVYYNTHAHYSIHKAINVTRSNSQKIQCDQYGEMDYNNLTNHLKKNQDKPAIIMANIGSTMVGAIDDLEKIKQCLEQAGIGNYYIHADAALHGFIVPFTNGPKKLNFELFDSISISGHKFLGSPLPCGIFLIKRSIVDEQKEYIEYIDAFDCTLTGSRSAITPLFLWYAITESGHEKLKENVTKCLDNTKYALEVLKEKSINAWAHEQSPIIVFDKPGDAVINKWQLAYYNNMSHAVIMPHMNKELIHELAEDIIADKNNKEVFDPNNPQNTKDTDGTRASTISNNFKNNLTTSAVAITAVSSIIALMLAD